MNRSLQIFFACAFGAGIGAFVALSLNPWFWWLGLLVGGTIGYLGYEWREVVAAVPRAWRAAGPMWKSLPWLVSKSWVFARTIAFMWCWLFVAFASCDFVGGLVSPVRGFHVASVAIATTLVVFGPGLVLIMGLFASCFLLEENEENRFYSLKEMVLWSLPVIFVYQLPRFTIRYAPAALRFVRAFVWKFFLLIHSEERLICGMDAMLGAAVGYFAGSAFIGAIAGGALGVVNYEIVTRRWLIPAGLVPVRVKTN